MNALAPELLSVFRTRWARMWAEHPDGLPGDVLDATKEALAAHFEAALQGRPAEVLPALHLAASTGTADHSVTYEFPMLLLVALARIDQDGHVLVKVAGDRAQPWYLRREALQALGGRTRPDLIPLLRRVLRDGETEGEVRTAALCALVALDSVESLDLIRSLSAQEMPWFSAEGPLLEARGRLGDLTATRDLIRLAADPWHHLSTAGQRGLAALEARAGGLVPLVQALQDPVPPRGLGRLLGLGRPSRQPERPLGERLHSLATSDPVDTVRSWAMTRLAELEPERATEVLLRALQDPDWQVLRNASDALSTLTPAPVAALHARVGNPELSLDDRRWAARTLLLLGESPDLETIPDLQVPLPAVVPRDVRATIVRGYSRATQAGTDVRWLIEALTLPRWDDTEEAAVQAEHDQVVQALRAYGVEVRDPVDAGDWHQQGGGTYVVLPLEGSDLSLSTLGRFAALHAWSEAGELPAPVVDRIRMALASVGWQWLDDVVLSVTVSGLNVYSFGRREPLQVNDLLFYWQD